MDEKDVFNQNVSEEELKAAAGGNLQDDDCGEPQQVRCHHNFTRDIYEGGFPNCAATVEDGSWCGSNDACLMADVDYQNMNDCKIAWR